MGSRGRSDEAPPCFRAIKKAPSGACLPRMGAFAGWLHHPAHAPSYHYVNECRVHGARANRKALHRQCMASP
ncbi:hypothetical protein FP026_28245 [Rhizobium tropici]|uniref:Uncharacterized protein n=1 Tax=Rhizobium tropici TaxID=398 RepID=A0A5B0VM04_RHITR|nr:hypothetical protein FP026_28245 [Rhizobium tropici]